MKATLVFVVVVGTHDWSQRWGGIADKCFNGWTNGYPNTPSIRGKANEYPHSQPVRWLDEMMNDRRSSRHRSSRRPSPRSKGIKRFSIHTQKERFQLLRISIVRSENALHKVPTLFVPWLSRLLLLVAAVVVKVVKGDGAFLVVVVRTVVLRRNSLISIVLILLQPKLHLGVS